METTTINGIVPFGVDTIQYKATRHHYCGFYSTILLSGIVNNVVIVDGDRYDVSNETVLDWAYDGIDTILTEKRIVYSNKPWLLHEPIYNVNMEIIGIVLQNYTHDADKYVYLVQDGYNLYSNLLSNVNLIVREKTKPIAYADQLFDTKKELFEYLNTTNLNKETGKYGAILYHQNSKNAQLMLHFDGKQLSNSHLRKNIFI
ncbi:ORF_56 [Adoxophyes orana granulovirus]|uniref:ADOR55 n=1 Tax=Adoxophyes orana granulovirus TaxID=170617 RepID=Q7T9V9_GVAO|nr:ORF_56 [Adoxophyes orana granulovirus]AAP85693.1 ORF_56 [Adoxophyes orana granulovirus]AJA91695.1 ADOR55 [Adoxophyes orana granulovirus]